MGSMPTRGFTFFSDQYTINILVIGATMLKKLVYAAGVYQISKVAIKTVKRGVKLYRFSNTPHGVITFARVKALSMVPIFIIRGKTPADWYAYSGGLYGEARDRALELLNEEREYQPDFAENYKSAVEDLISAADFITLRATHRAMDETVKKDDVE